MATFIPARNFTPTSGRQIDLIVIHDMEAPEGPLTAENVANYFAGNNGPAPRASTHWNFDNNSAVRSVLDKDVAWHAPGANHNSLGYEHAGYARQTREEWLDEYGQAMLAISAAQARVDSVTYDLPIVFVDVAGLRAGLRGITTHAAVSKAFGRSSHWDPGPGFPMDHYLRLIAGLPSPEEEDDMPTVEEFQRATATLRLVRKSGTDAVYVTDTAARTYRWVQDWFEASRLVAMGVYCRRGPDDGNNYGLDPDHVGDEVLQYYAEAERVGP